MAIEKKKKVFTMLENNPEVMTPLAHELGLSKSLAFHDVYSLTDTDILSFIPRPIHALLVTIPMTPSWNVLRQQEDSVLPSTAKEPTSVFWFKQTITNACGMIGLLHCLLNSVPDPAIATGSLLEKLKKEVEGLKWEERAKALEDSEELLEINERFAEKGDTRVIGEEESKGTGNHFVAFVKGRDGRLWELEGGRPGALDRGIVDEEGKGDLLMGMLGENGLGRYVDLAEKSGDGVMRFSCVVLAGEVDA